MESDLRVTMYLTNVSATRRVAKRVAGGQRPPEKVIDWFAPWKGASSTHLSSELSHPFRVLICYNLLPVVFSR